MDDRPHIVVVEDEATQRDLLVGYLSRHGFRVSGIDAGRGLRQLIERELPALVMLDIGLPGEDGFALARWLRERSGRVGIIMVTAATDMVDRVVGLETVRTITSPNPSSRASCWRGSRACCGARRSTMAAPCRGGSPRFWRRISPATAGSSKMTRKAP